MSSMSRRAPAGHPRGAAVPSAGIESTWGEGLPLVVSGLIVLYGASVWAHLLLDGEVGRRLAVVDGVSGVVALAVLAVLALLRPGRPGRLLLSALLGIAAGANALAHVVVEQDLGDTVLVVVVLVVVAGGVTSSPVAGGLVLLLWAGWLAVTLPLSDDPGWLDHLADLGIGTLAGFMLHVGRRVTVLRLIGAQLELARLTERDDLTGLANRRGFFAALRRALEEAATSQQRLVVLYCDVDGLKRVNDSRGHEAGDLLLVDVARRLREEFADARCVGRLGGDEFGVVLLGGGGAAGTDEATARARRVRDDTAEAVWSLSVGAASSDELPGLVARQAGGAGVLPPHELLGAVLGLADERMYEAKRLRPARRDGVLD